MHTVTLDGFYMEVTEVTNAQYQVFMQQTEHRQSLYWNDNRFN
ncbi:MAG: SUMF1/EgtB/PvdO family nonheme iron enzyme [Candidatus Poribacteria bacterium]|nr:SUMF1/EgtB/PvdO family nonheme iron enzyme [Candidatus Poribacteria bacterium]MDP6751990.1 SUMF1/EgtB/PvdO family nonheme iron enzyme [Candidatus Poribacteria bacterium]MDP6995422.1 SUMF1/EgtB/PvdO family nonheme iron enzyme [Candidatus Poribacteria bacterium]